MYFQIITSEVSVQRPNRLISVVPWYYAYQVCCSDIFYMILRWYIIIIIIIIKCTFINVFCQS